MQTPSWFVVTLLLASLSTPAVRASDIRTRCASSTVTEGERAVITYHLHPDIDYSTGVLYIRRDQEPGQILICDGTCEVRNGHFRSEGITGTTLTLEVPAVTKEEQGRYYLFAVVDAKQQTPCACNITVVAKADSLLAAVPPSEEDSTSATLVIGVLGLLILLATGGLLLYLLVINKRRKRNLMTPNKTQTEDSEKGLIQENGVHAGDDSDTTKASEAKGETTVLVDNDASEPTPPHSPSSPPDSGLSSTPQVPRVDRDGEATKVPEAEGETDALLSNGTSDPTLPLVPAPPPENGVAIAPQGPPVDGSGALQSVDLAGHTAVISPDCSVDKIGHSTEERPASLLDDRATMETVIFVIDALRFTDVKLRETMDQDTHGKDVDSIWNNLGAKTQLLEIHMKWEALRRQIARRVNLKPTFGEQRDMTNLLVKDAVAKYKLQFESLLSKQFKAFCQETNSHRGETDKACSAYPRYPDFNVVCLSLTLRNMVDMSVKIREGNTPDTDNVLVRVAIELGGMAQVHV